MDIFGPNPDMTTEDKETRQYIAGNILFLTAAIFTLIAMVLGVARLVMDRRRLAKRLPQPNEQPSDAIDESHPILEKDQKNESSVPSQPEKTESSVPLQPEKTEVYK